MRLGTGILEGGPGQGAEAGQALSPSDCELLIALHATRSAPAVRAWRTARPRGPLIVVLTGTDVYPEGDYPAAWRETLAAADRIVALQPRALDRLDAAQRSIARVVPQSALAPPVAGEPDPEAFEVCALGHLRDVKDPLLLARAVRLLPERSRVRAVHVGTALDARWEAAARRESSENPRWRWLGGLTRRAALERLSRARLLVVSSRNEGGPAVVTEALAAGLPVLSTRMPAAEALFGRDHPGLYPLGDAAALAELLWRAEQEPAFLEDLRRRSLERRDEVSPARERERIAALLDETLRACRDAPGSRPADGVR